MTARPDDAAEVERLLGRRPQGDFEVVVRHADGSPLVIRNAPLLDDGTPMPTRFWLVGEPERTWVSRLESAGGVDRAEAEVDPVALADAHARYAAERDAALPPGHAGPRPFGGVAGTRQGVKCLHAHYAWFLAGGNDPVGRWVDERVGPGEPGGPASSLPGMSTAIASVDMGTNSTRVLVARPDGGRLDILDRRNTITRLGQGVGATGRLADEAVERTLACLRDYREVLDRHGVERVRAATTSAARDAANRDEFLDAAEQVIGVRPELLSGDEEGRLSFVGATGDLDPALGPFLVVDIGGGSTEFILGGDEVEGVLSVDIGCVRLTEKFLAHDPPLPEELTACISLTDAYLDDVVRELPGSADARTVVGLAGTITTVAAVEMGLASYDRDRIHHFRLTRAAAEDVFRTLATESLADRLHNPGLEAARADVIVGGCCVLVAVLRRFGLDEIVVSEADILDGLALSLVE
jgi:exopolyphosphatase/guanosine-5'-triphosphate,3'-diphosphate pyrophosphatase